jgi:hypothetical protein
VHFSTIVPCTGTRHTVSIDCASPLNHGPNIICTPSLADLFDLYRQDCSIDPAFFFTFGLL